MPSVVSATPSRGRFMLELLVAFLLTRLPFISIPFKWLESYFHELSHGIAALLTGGIVSHIQLFPNGAGLCFSQGGISMVIAYAGYFGAALWGYVIFLLATKRSSIRFTLGLLGLTVAASLVFWARDILTIAILLVLTILFLLPLKLKNSSVLNTLLRILGIMIILNAMASPMVLLGLSGQGDAVMLAQLTWIPAWIWVMTWLLFSGLMLWLCWQKVDYNKGVSK
ncbi:M50 family metallopeptidase [Shewanella saliphila]|uniref:Membrane zinc metalloprotease n=1 Tax=Shewanella saliphila TaxID=2282698 RepID=A0ABQ2Q5L0_9GAMM|nr:M50 family metallopeptidase [Shewanella saliphila]MCL1102068.1 M50 family metallopeptidase [Shewanella saliphila]GGP53286.1 membrane zinc metalloprotease [Shewanella saliphila]